MEEVVAVMVHLNFKMRTKKDNFEKLTVNASFSWVYRRLRWGRNWRWSHFRGRSWRRARYFDICRIKVFRKLDEFVDKLLPIHFFNDVLKNFVLDKGFITNNLFWQRLVTISPYRNSSAVLGRACRNSCWSCFCAFPTVGRLLPIGVIWILLLKGHFRNHWCARESSLQNPHAGFRSQLGICAAYLQRSILRKCNVIAAAECKSKSRFN